MRKQETFDLDSCDFPTCRELTEEELLCVNGGKKIENSNAAVAEAQVGDSLTRNDGTTVTITQGDIDWAKKQVGGSGGSNKSGGEEGSSGGDSVAAGSDKEVKVAAGNSSASAGSNSGSSKNAGSSYNGSSASSSSGGSSSGNSSSQNYTPALTPQQQYEMAKADEERKKNDAVNNVTDKTELETLSGVPAIANYLLVDSKGNSFGERQYHSKYVLTVPAGYSQNFLDASNAYFCDRKIGNSGKEKIDSIALTDSVGNIIHLFSNDREIQDYRKYAETVKSTVKISTKDFFQYTNTAVGTVSGIYETVTGNKIVKNVSLGSEIVSTVLDSVSMISEPSFLNGYTLCADLAGFIPYVGLAINIGMTAFASYANYRNEQLYGLQEENSDFLRYDGTF